MARLPSKSINRPSAQQARSRFSDEYGLLLQRLIEARLKAGVTQEEIARHLGKAQSHVSLCENRDREISIIDLWKWCDAIGVVMSDFIKQFEADVQQLPKSKKHT